ncbi:ABC-type glycerol-3-phosphate transport system substrate-binding protein [Agromyces ramosus]|uniref:ABC-type glycerol-3-phosphate transport system substrate-binding protein n=2 Tax=Agromyces ramosus TaxID=33879 RepID=A0ABU0RBV6_9MICO|nr:ABC-type glycerol-3-phosphate transport system substrate-binding protein [Agromyces ramosus]
MQKIMTSTALLFAGALLLTGCAAGGGGAEASASADPCEAVRVEVRDISNGAQNALTAGGEPADVQASLEGYSERVDALDESAGDDEAVSDALEALGEKIDDAAEFAATLPAAPEAEVDADAVAEHQTAIQESAAEVTSACGAE